MIYGVGIISICVILGQGVGELLGMVAGLNTNVGGVGFAMAFLILVTGAMKKKGKLKSDMEDGINFCNKMYIPVVIAMTASQNVVQAISQGFVAVLAGIVACLVGLLLVPVFCKEKGEQA